MRRGLRSKLGWAAATVLAAGFPTAALAQSEDGSRLVTVYLIGLIIFALVYFIPTIVAFRRGHPNRWAIAVINFVFGATGLGWLGSLVWACSAIHLSPTGSNGGESGLNIFANDPVTVKLETSTVSAPPGEDVSERLQRLKRLFDTEVITPEEYAELRKPLLVALLSR